MSNFVHPVRTILGTIVLTAFAGCSSDKRPEPPAFAQTCTARTPQAISPAPRPDMTAPYFGCANDLNLQAMVDDPADLKRGRPLGPASGDRESTAVDTYRQGKIPPFGQTATPASAVTIMSGGSTGSQ